MWVPLLWTAGNAAAATGGTAAGGRMRAFPLPRNQWGRTIDRIGIQVTAAAAAGHVLRAALYADSGAGYPGALVRDFGELTIASTGVKTLGPGLAQVIPDRAWVAVWQSANATIRSVDASTVHAPLGVSSALTDVRGQWWEHVTAYTLGVSVYPSTFASGATRTGLGSTGLPCVFALFV